MCFGVANSPDYPYYRGVQVMSAKDAAEVLVS